MQNEIYLVVLILVSVKVVPSRDYEFSSVAITSDPGRS